MDGTNDMQSDDEVAHLRSRIADLEAELALLKAELRKPLSAIPTRFNIGNHAHGVQPRDDTGSISPTQGPQPSTSTSSLHLSLEEYKRYGRQMIVPQIGLEGQLRLRNASVLIIGVGGLGCPAAAYLAGAGVGTIGLMDGDVVEESNLHRQVCHGTSRVGMLKVDSAIEYLRELNPHPTYIAHPSHLMPSSLSTLAPYTLLLDCTDTPQTRYLISDASILLRTPLISTAYLKLTGHLTLLNHPSLPPGDPLGKPCYRCLFPVPPPRETIGMCSENGVLGPGVGVMGVLAAVEALRVLVSPPENAAKEEVKMTLFNAWSNPQFRTLKMRQSRRPTCAVCSSTPTITRESLESGEYSYETFCGGVPAPGDTLTPEERIPPSTLREVTESKEKHILIDVRPAEHFAVHHHPGSINIPFSTFLQPEVEVQLPPDLPLSAPVYVICRLGNDSQVAVRRMKQAGLDRGGERWVGDVKGGWRAWREEVDSKWPEF